MKKFNVFTCLFYVMVIAGCIYLGFFLGSIIHPGMTLYTFVPALKEQMAHPFNIKVTSYTPYTMAAIFLTALLSVMVRKTIPSGGRKYIYYVCSGNKKDKSSCSPHRIPETELTDTVLCLVQMHIEKVLTLEKAMEAIEKAPKMKADAAKFDERIRRKREELEKAEKRKLNLYEDLKDGIISKKEYLQLKAEYDRRIGEAETSVCSYEKELILLLESKSSLHEWIREFKEYRNIRTLDRNAAVVMIKKVFVYSADRIEVIYNFTDEFERCMEYAAAYGEVPERKEAV